MASPIAAVAWRNAGRSAYPTKTFSLTQCADVRLRLIGRREASVFFMNPSVSTTPSVAQWGAHGILGRSRFVRVHFPRFRPVWEPFARFPRRIERVPFLGLRHRCERVRLALLSSDAARPGRRGPRRMRPFAPAGAFDSSASPSSTGMRRTAFTGWSRRRDLFVVVRGIIAHCPVAPVAVPARSSGRSRRSSTARPDVHYRFDFGRADDSVRPRPSRPVVARPSP